MRHRPDLCIWAERVHKARNPVQTNAVSGGTLATTIVRTSRRDKIPQKGDAFYARFALRG